MQTIYDELLENLVKEVESELIREIQEGGDLKMINNIECFNSYVKLICKYNFKSCNPESEHLSSKSDEQCLLFALQRI